MPETRTSASNHALEQEVRSLKRQMGTLAHSNDYLRQSNELLKAELERRTVDYQEVVNRFYRMYDELSQTRSELHRLTHPFADATNRARTEIENMPRAINAQVIPEEATRLEELAHVFQCSRCGQGSYASREDQAVDWPFHQTICVEKQT
jgi:predicted nuclease with TOPRIM domain